MQHLISIIDLTPADVQQIFTLTLKIKNQYLSNVREPLLQGRVMAMLFEKPSLRTRVSFESGMIQLGGGSLFLGDGDDVGFNRDRESLADFGRVLSQFVDVVVVRSKAHKTVTDLARYCDCPVINGLTDHDHPCQALADLLTLQELVGELKGKKLTYVGDANNVARSLMELCAFLDVTFAIASPVGYRFDDHEIQELKKLCPKLRYELHDDPVQAVKGAVAVYTDVWTSMGQEAETAKRKRDFADYQVNTNLMSHAPNAYFMHCLPAHRGEEVTSEVMDSKQSIVVKQAANRMHVQKGVLAWLLK
jgi:ornithine carbamoyltransferase